MTTQPDVALNDRGFLDRALTADRLTRIGAAITLLLALAATVGIVALIIVLNGANPVTAFLALAEGSLGGQFELGQTIMITSLLALTGLAAAIPFTARLWNVGGEGQLYMGAIIATAVAVSVSPGLPAWVFAPMVVIAGMIGGAIWAFVPGFLKATIGANEVIVTLMLTFAAIHLGTYVIRGVWPQGVAPQTRPAAENALLPQIWPAALVNVGAILAVVSVLVAWVILGRTSLGFQIKATGFNPRTSRLFGISSQRVTMVSFALGGAFAGLAGTILVVGINDALITGFSANYGFIGIAVALLARLNLAAVLPAALLFAVLNVGSSSFQAAAGLDPAVGDIIVATLVLLLIFFRVVGMSTQSR